MVANFYKRSADFFWIDSNNSSKWSLNNDDHLFNKSYIDFESDSGLNDSTSYWSFGKNRLLKDKKDVIFTEYFLL